MHAEPILASGWRDVPVMVAAYLSAVLIHELGHVGAAMAVGMRLLSLAIFPLRLRCTHDRKVHLSAVTLKEHVGECQVFPADVKNLCRRYLLVGIGGPLLSAVAAAIVIATFAEIAIPAQTTGAHFLWWFTVYSLTGALMSLAPGLGTNDMAMIRLLFAGGMRGERFAACLAVGSKAQFDNSYGGLDLSLLDRLCFPVELPPNFEAASLPLGYRWAYSLEDWGRAKILLDRMGVFALRQDAAKIAPWIVQYVDDAARWRASQAANNAGNGESGRFDNSNEEMWVSPQPHLRYPLGCSGRRRRQLALLRQSRAGRRRTLRGCRVEPGSRGRREDA